tara:strand:+ start:1387 stop:1578 length:192 start_codon:yes stop_codon:yes gene_type:complete
LGVVDWQEPVDEALSVALLQLPILLVASILQLATVDLHASHSAVALTQGHASRQISHLIAGTQ